jgi:hypothetical protein
MAHKREQRMRYPLAPIDIPSSWQSRLYSASDLECKRQAQYLYRYAREQHELDRAMGKSMAMGNPQSQTFVRQGLSAFKAATVREPRSRSGSMKPSGRSEESQPYIHAGSIVENRTPVYDSDHTDKHNSGPVNTEAKADKKTGFTLAYVGTDFRKESGGFAFASVGVFFEAPKEGTLMAYTAPDYKASWNMDTFFAWARAYGGITFRIDKYRKGASMGTVAQKRQIFFELEHRLIWTCNNIDTSPGCMMNLTAPVLKDYMYLISVIAWCHADAYGDVHDFQHSHAEAQVEATTPWILLSYS